MEHRHLGSSGLKISELAYGNWLTHASQVERDQAQECVNAALDAGITTFDTADVYAGTRAEALLGELLAGHRRDGLEIFTKVYWPTGPGQNDVGLSRKHILRSAEASLRRLRTDYIDLYQAHRFDVMTPLEETLRAFDDLVRSGKVLYIGVSEWTAEQIGEALRIADEMGLDRIVSNQPQYSMLWRVIEAEVVPTCIASGIGQIVWSPLAQGVLTGKYKPGQPPPPGTRAMTKEGGRFMARWLEEPVLQRVAELQTLAADYGLSLPELSLAWVLAQPGISAAIIGATRAEQVQQNVRASGMSLDAELLAQVDEVLGDAIVLDPGLTRSPSERP
ncbi:MAG: aldo/keto reductase family protein [Actinobacteria bacterium]|nr:aldo/keto reductase family protein [Actinomycetota bacterium]